MTSLNDSTNPTGLFAQLTPEQQTAALAYDGPQDHGDPAFALISVTLTAERWRRIASCLDWHGKDHESELIVDAIREQTGDA